MSEIASPNATKTKRRRRVNSLNQSDDAKKKKTPIPSTSSNTKKTKEASPVNPAPATNMMVTVKSDKGPLSDNDAIMALDLVTLQTWCSLGSFADSMQLPERAISCYEAALAKDPQFVPALVGIAGVHRDNDNFPKAIEYYHAALAVDKSVGTTWEALAHCYLMADNLRDSYSAYQQALNLLSDPNVPKLWYGIAILYDRCETYELAKEAFQRVLTIDPSYDKKSDIYFRLGIIHKHEKNYLQALESFKLIVDKPPAPLSSIDIWFQIGNIHEVLEDFQSARMAYEHILAENPAHAKVLQQLGWLHYQQYMKNKTGFQQPPVPRDIQESLLEQAIARLSQSLDYETTDGYTWYLLGRSLMQQDRHSQAYAAYQQAVYRDSQNPRFWCSIGILYFRINQYRDALDAYTRAIRLAPESLPEAWYNAAILYEVSNNQTNDAISALENAIKSDTSNGPNAKMYQAYLHLLNSNSPVPEELRSPIEPTVPVDRPLPQTGSGAAAPGAAAE